MTGKIFIKLIAGVIAVLLVASATLDVLVSRLTEQTYIKNRRTDLIEKARMIADLSSDGFSSLPREEFVRLARRAAVRMTVVAPDGTVLADSGADPARMNNHRTRPEVAAALSGSVGSSVRISPTMGVPFLYVAVPIPAGALRLAVPLAPLVNAANRARPARWVLEKLELMLGKEIGTIHVVGGGSQNWLLCQLTADATQRPVVAGPVEATSTGNILMQAIAHGEVGSLAEAREIVRRSFELITYEPHGGDGWEEAYRRFLKIKEQLPKVQ